MSLIEENYSVVLAKLLVSGYRLEEYGWGSM